MIISEQYDFTMTTHKGIEVGIITDHDQFGPTGVKAFHMEHGELVETDPNELFDLADWVEYHELYNELERTQRI